MIGDCRFRQFPQRDFLCSGVAIRSLNSIFVPPASGTAVDFKVTLPKRSDCWAKDIRTFGGC